MGQTVPKGSEPRTTLKEEPLVDAVIGLTRLMEDGDGRKPRG